MLSSHVTKLTKKRPQRSCFPSIATLAKELGCGKGAVRQSLLRLAEWGLICIEERHTNNAHISKLYTLPALPAIPVKIATTMELVHDNLQGGAVVVDEQDAAFQYTGEYYDLSGES